MTLIEKVVIVVILVILAGWVGSIIKLANCDFKAPYKAEVIYTVGIVVPPLGAVVGWMELGKIMFILKCETVKVGLEFGGYKTEDTKLVIADMQTFLNTYSPSANYYELSPVKAITAKDIEQICNKLNEDSI